MGVVSRRACGCGCSGGLAFAGRLGGVGGLGLLAPLGSRVALIGTSRLAARSRLPVLVSLAVSVAVVAVVMVRRVVRIPGPLIVTRPGVSPLSLTFTLVLVKVRDTTASGHATHRRRSIQPVATMARRGDEWLLRRGADVVVAVGDHRMPLAPVQLEAEGADRGVGDHRERRGQMPVVGDRVVPRRLTSTSPRSSINSVGSVRIWRPDFGSVRMPLTK